MRLIIAHILHYMLVIIFYFFMMAVCWRVYMHFSCIKCEKCQLANRDFLSDSANVRSFSLFC